MQRIARTRAGVIAGVYLVVAVIAAVRVLTPGVEGLYGLLATVPWGIIGIVVVDALAPELASSFAVNLLLVAGSVVLNTLLIYWLVARAVGREKAAGAAR